MLLLHKVCSSPHLTTTPLKLVPTQHLGLSLTGKCGSKTLVQDILTPVFATCTESNKRWDWKLGSNQDWFYGSFSLWSTHWCVLSYPIPVCPLCVCCHVLVSLAMIEKHMLVGLCGGSVGCHGGKEDRGDTGGGQVCMQTRDSLVLGCLLSPVCLLA